jgi:hypothetical protein
MKLILAILIAIIFALVLIEAQSDQTEQKWAKFKSSHKRMYKSRAAETYRREVFMRNLAEIDKHNKEAAEGKHSYTLGVNKFTDLTYEEFVNRFAGLRLSDSQLDSVKRRVANQKLQVSVSSTTLPTSFGKNSSL